jgi:hypothetical protein
MRSRQREEGGVQPGPGGAVGTTPRRRSIGQSDTALRRGDMPCGSTRLPTRRSDRQSNKWKCSPKLFHYIWALNKKLLGLIRAQTCISSKSVAISGDPT